jgi:hypothetical protein
MTKCEISQCGREIEDFDPSTSRVDGSTLVQVLKTGRVYWVCANCLNKLGLK